MSKIEDEPYSCDHKIAYIQNLKIIRQKIGKLMDSDVFTCDVYACLKTEHKSKISL